MSVFGMVDVSDPGEMVHSASGFFRPSRSRTPPHLRTLDIHRGARQRRTVTRTESPLPSAQWALPLILRRTMTRRFSAVLIPPLLLRLGSCLDHHRSFRSLTPDGNVTYALGGGDFEVWIMSACLKSALPHTRLFGARRRLVAKGSSARYRSQESPPHAKPLRVVASSHLS